MVELAGMRLAGNIKHQRLVACSVTYDSQAGTYLDGTFLNCSA